MPNVTTVWVRCYECGHRWHQPLGHPIIGAANGDTITVVPRAINVECPECGTQVVNYTATAVHVTGESIRGFFALLQSLTSEDIKKLATIAAEATESGASTEAIAERIKASIPSLRPVLAPLTSPVVTAWIAILLMVAQIIISVKGTSPAVSPAQRPAIIIECPSGEEQKISDLLGQIAGQLKSALNASEAAATAGQGQGDRSKHH